MKLIKYLIILVFIFAIVNLSAATHIVTSSSDDGECSLRKIIADASAGDTIIFASNIDKIILTSGQITIDKYLVEFYKV